MCNAVATIILSDSILASLWGNLYSSLCCGLSSLYVPTGHVSDSRCPSLVYYISETWVFYESAFLHAFQLANRQSLPHQSTVLPSGSWLSVYEKLLIPLYASAQFHITKPRRLTPLSGMSYRWVFCRDEKQTECFYLSPSIGAQFKVNRNLKLNLMAGWPDSRNWNGQRNRKIRISIRRLRKNCHNSFHYAGKSAWLLLR